MYYKSVCIVGVDGAGKSTTIELLNKKIGTDKSCVQYMGARQWETRLAKNNVENNTHYFPFRAIMFIYSFIYEFYYRVNKHKKDNKLIIFDRYTFEQVYFRERTGTSFIDKIQSFIFRIFLIWLFPKPDLTVYLTCPTSVSIERKTDINTKEQIESLKMNKKCLDNCYEGRRGVYTIDTSMKSQREVVETIERLIIEKELLP